MLKLDITNLVSDAACAASNVRLPAGSDAVRVATTCGAQRDDDTPATTVITLHDPHAFLAALRIARAADVPAPSAAPAAAARSGAGACRRETRSRSRGGTAAAAAAASSNGGGGASLVCASTGATLRPQDLVLLLPSVAATGEPPNGPLAVTLAAVAEVLRPAVQVVGREAAAAALAVLPGLQDLDDRQRAEARTALDAATAAAAAARATDSGSGGMGSESSGGGASGDGGETAAAAGAGATAAAATAAAVDAVVRFDDDAQGSKRRRVTRGGADGGGGDAAQAAAMGGGHDVGRPPLPGRSGPVKKAADGDGAVAPAATTDPRADLDRERAELMERNRRMLMQLQLPGLVAGLTAAAAEHGAAAGGAGDGGKPRQASQRGVGAKRSREASQEPPPRRVSLRQRGVAADAALAAGIEHETAGGVQLVAGRQAVEAATGKAGGAASGPEKEKERHPKGELPFRSDNGDEATDAAFVASLKASATADAAASGPDRAAAACDLGGEALARLRLAERDVAKVTKDGVTHMAWLPGCERLLLAAADKAGKVSLWDVDVQEGGLAADTDGVLMFSPHSEYVSGLRWLGRDAAVGSCRLITAAYDGSLRALDLGGGGTWLELPAPGDPRVAEFSALEVSPDGRTAYLGDPLGNLDIVDLRAPPPPLQPASGEKGSAAGGSGAEAGKAEAAGKAGPLQILSRKVNSLHLEPSAGHLLASSCSDGTVCLWDVRQLQRGAAARAASGHKGAAAAHATTKPLSVLRHGKSCHAAYWAPDGSGRLLSTSYDDTLRVWSAPSGGGKSSAGGGGGGGTSAADGARFAQQLSIPHNNQTGRWITPFRAVWNATGDAVLVGNMKRGLDVFSLHGDGVSGGAGGKATGRAAGQLLRTLTSDHMTAIPSRVACHPTLPVVVAATSSGRCHVWR